MPKIGTFFGTPRGEFNVRILENLTIYERYTYTRIRDTTGFLKIGRIEKFKV